ncbi:hypothetical protein AB4212_64155, partial [Streptomyces sp. 2MCAF27]
TRSTCARAMGEERETMRMRSVDDMAYTIGPPQRAPGTGRWRPRTLPLSGLVSLVGCRPVG